MDTPVLTGNIMDSSRGSWFIVCPIVDISPAKDQLEDRSNGD